MQFFALPQGISLKVLLTIFICNLYFYGYAFHNNTNISLDTLPSNCYAVSDQGNPDVLFIYDKDTDMWTNIGSTGVFGIEAVAFNQIDQKLYTFDANIFGSIDLTDGSFTAIGTALGNGDGSLGSIVINDIDGLTYDPYLNIFWASHRRNGPANHDVLVQIDPATGAIIPDAFGPNIDYVIFQEVFDTETNQLVYDIDDIAIDIQTGELYGIANQGGSGGMLVIYDETNGTVDQVIGSFDGIDDMESLGFFTDGSLFGSTGNNGPDPVDNNKYYRLDKTTGDTIESFVIDPTGTQLDFEACDCASGLPNEIAGIVDISGSCPCSELSTWDDIVVKLYSDINGNGLIDIGTDNILNTDTISNGDMFNFSIAATGNFIVNLDSMSMPTNFSYDGTTQHTAFFDATNQIDNGNDFEFCANIAPSLVSQTCNNNGTENSGNDDYMTIEVTAENSAAGSSHLFEVLYNGTVLNPGGTAYGTNAILGSGQEFSSNGSSIYTLVFRDLDFPLCETSMDVQSTPTCSSCKAICLPISIIKN